MNSNALALEAPAGFDSGPLSWVRKEIDQNLDRSLAALAAFAAAPAETSHLGQARTQIHQAAGAIRMVGLEGVDAYTDEIETLLAWLETAPPEAVPAAARAVDRACRRLKIHLDELVNGAPPVPLKLHAEYEAMQKSRGVAAPSPVDLFFPDLSVRPPRGGLARALDAEQTNALLLKARRAFQHGMLLWLRGSDEGLQHMRVALQAIEHTQGGPQQRAFWWTAVAFVDALLGKGLDAGFSAKQLCARLDLQIRRFLEGSTRVADRLRREVLYHVAVSAPVSAAIREVCTTYRLAELLPPPQAPNTDLIRVQPALREAREQLALAKDAWVKLNSGRPDALAKLKQALAALTAAVERVGRDDLTRLARTLCLVLDTMPVEPVPDALALEYATGMLLAESALENFANLGPDFSNNVDAMIARLDAGGLGQSEGGVPVLDEMARRAHDRLVLAAVVKEIAHNLRHIEQVLDAFFRDPQRRGDLATLGHYAKQIEGALRILGLDRAERLLALCTEQITRYAQTDAPVAGDELELLAESLSGLGFYIEAVEQQRPDCARLIEPLLRKRTGAVEEAPKAREASLEATLESRLAALPALVEAIVGGDAGRRPDLRLRLTEIRHDAELTANATLAERAAAALALVDDPTVAGSHALATAVRDLARPVAVEPAPGPSEESLRLVSVSKEKLDSELIDIYLAEAGEVLATMADQFARLQSVPDDREALRTVRRGFHTLKGSGRMVGLTELGELAWEVEKAHNRWLEEERPASAALLALIDVARRSFEEWVGALQRDGRLTLDAEALRAAVARVEAELSPGGPPGSGGGGPSAPTPPRDRATPVLRLVEPVGGASALATAGPAVPVPPESPCSAPPEDAIPASGPEVAPGTVDPVTSFDVDAAAHGDACAVAAPSSVTIGEVTLSAALHQILCDEAGQHLVTLRRELEAMQFNPAQRPSDAMVRASHTLRGIHRTSGLMAVADTASALEQCLLATQEAGGRVGEAGMVAIAGTVDVLSRQLARIRGREDFDAPEREDAAEAIARLDALRRDMKSRAALQPAAFGGAAKAVPAIASAEASSEVPMRTFP